MDLKILVAHIQETDIFFRGRAAKSIDKFLTTRNWLIGGYIVHYEQNGKDRAEYGKKILESIANSIDVKGMSFRSLKLFRQFYLAYPEIGQTVSALFENEQISIGQTLSAQSIIPLITHEKNEAHTTEKKEIGYGIAPKLLIENLSFSHFVELLKLEGLQREYYEIECIKGTWSVRELKRQINSLAFERTGAAVSPERISSLLQANSQKTQPSELIRNPYVFDFLKLPDSALGSESALEQALITELKSFILELGNGFCFEAQQKRIVIGGEYFFVDLVFYHRILQCHVLIELKIDAFNHSNVGQLNSYLQYFKKNVKTENDNPPIGILLCTQKNDELVEFALGGMDENLFISKYQTNLPSTEKLQAFLKQEKRKLNEHNR